MSSQIVISKQNEIISHLRKELAAKEELVIALQLKVAELQTGQSLQILDQLRKLGERGADGGDGAPDAGPTNCQRELQLSTAQSTDSLVPKAALEAVELEARELRERLEKSEQLRGAQRQRLEELINKYEQQSNLVASLKELNQALKERAEMPQKIQ